MPKKKGITSKPSRKQKKPKEKVAWSEEDEIHRQALIDSAETYAKARQEVLSIPGTSVIGEIQYAMSLLYEQYKAETWPDMYKAKYDLSLAESPMKEALVAARALEAHSNLTSVLYQQFNFDFDWIGNESSRILSHAIGEKYDDDDDDDDSMKEYDNSDIIENKRVNDCDFPKMSKQDFRDYGMKGGPVTRLADSAEECKDKKSRAFSSYLSLSEVLRKYGIDGNDVKKIPPFVLEPVKIDDGDEKLEQCITEIKSRMGIIGSATDNNEAVHCEYISPILYASIYIARRITKKKITLDPQFEVVSDEASGRAIKKVIGTVNEELIAITESKQKDLMAGFMRNVVQLESSYHTNTRKRKASVAFDDEFDYLYGIVTTSSDWYFIMYTPEKIYCSKSDYQIILTEDILDDDTKLRQGVKEVMGVIVSLLKDRIEADDSPDSKRVRTKKYIRE